MITVLGLQGGETGRGKARLTQVCRMGDDYRDYMILGRGNYGKEHSFRPTLQLSIYWEWKGGAGGDISPQQRKRERF